MAHANTLIRTAQSTEVAYADTLDTRRMSNKQKRFFYFQSKHKQRPNYKLNKEEWEAILSKQLPQMSSRHVVATNNNNGRRGGKQPFDSTTTNTNSNQTADSVNTNTNNHMAAKQHTLRPITPIQQVDVRPNHRRTWAFKKTRELFGVEDGNVRDHLEQTIQTFDTAIETRNIAIVLTKPHETMKEETIEESTVLHVHSKILHLRLAYRIALNKLDNGFTWRDCCTQACNAIRAVGEKSVQPTTVETWNKQYRANGVFPHPLEHETTYTPILFQQYPEAVQLAKLHLSQDLEGLCVEIFEEEFDNLTVQEKAWASEQVLKEGRLKTISTTTSCKWLSYLQYSYGQHDRHYYSDRHEFDENKIARVDYGLFLKDTEYRKYRWVQLSQEQKEHLESLEKQPLATDAFVRSFETDNPS